MSEAYDELKAEFNRLTITLAFDVIDGRPEAVAHARRLLLLSGELAAQVIEDTDVLLADIRGALDAAEAVRGTREVDARELRRPSTVHPAADDLEP